MYQAQGQLDDALRIIKEKCLPVFDQLGDKPSLLVARANIAIIKMKRLASGDLDDAEAYLELALAAAQEMGLPEAEPIQALMEQVQQQQKHAD